MHSGGAMRLDFGEGLFLDGSDDYVKALSAGCIKDKNREASVAGYQTESLFWLHGGGQDLVGSDQRLEIGSHRFWPTQAPGCQELTTTPQLAPTTRYSPPTTHLITPLSDCSMKRMSMSASSPRSGSDLSFSKACVVLSFEASRVLYAW